ncbi:hypothetical protein Tco_0870918 [Tanacetum coccineum]
MAEQDTPPPTITAMKIPIIKKGEYDIWSMRMRQYICHTDHNLWDVIVNGDLEEEAAPSGEQSTPPAYDEDDVSAVKIVSPVKTNETKTVRNRVDKIGQISQKEGIGFKKIKACFICLVNPVRPNGKRAVHTVITARPISTVRPISTDSPIRIVRPFAPKIAQTGSAIRPIYLIMDKCNPEICLQDHAVVDSVWIGFEGTTWKLTRLVTVQQICAASHKKAGAARQKFMLLVTITTVVFRNLQFPNINDLKQINAIVDSKFLTLESIKDSQAAKISALKSRIKKFEKKCKPSISHHRAWLKSVKRLSIKKIFGKKEFVSKKGRKKSKPESTLVDSTVFDDQDADHGMEYIETEEAMDEGRQSGKTEEVKLTNDIEVVEDKSSGDKGGNARKTIRTAKPEVIDETSRPAISMSHIERTSNNSSKDKVKGLEGVTSKESPDKRKKLLAEERVAAVRNKPPTRTQLRSLMMTYLKHTSKYRHNQLNKKTFEEIQALYIKEQERESYLVPIGLSEMEQMNDKMNKKAAGMVRKRS